MLEGCIRLFANMLVEIAKFSEGPYDSNGPMESGALSSPSFIPPKHKSLIDVSMPLSAKSFPTWLVMYVWVQLCSTK